jgi:hypothetical protein
MSGDPEFEDFLKRRRPLFRGDVDDGLEPPAELDRIVLRQARDAIEDDRPIRFFGMPRWAAPVAIAATLVLGISIVFKAGVQPQDRVPEVRVETVAQRVDVGTGEPMGAVMSAPPAEAAPPAEEPVGTSPSVVSIDLAPPKAAAPAWRHDAKAWQAEIRRLRASGDNARADAEQAEFNREYRAYAGAPDR